MWPLCKFAHCFSSEFDMQKAQQAAMAVSSILDRRATEIFISKINHESFQT